MLRLPRGARITGQAEIRLPQPLNASCSIHAHARKERHPYSGGGYPGYLLPRLPDEDDEAYKKAAKACEQTLDPPQGHAGETRQGWDRTRLAGMLVLLRNLVTHSGEKAYLHEIGWDQTRLRYELGNRFSKLAVSLKVDFQKMREEWADSLQQAEVWQQQQMAGVE